jgi:2-polyprenyl-3-methyl-5-hydroxy-6-metoxy-1,4-benzoquinol methylase
VPFCLGVFVVTQGLIHEKFRIQRLQNRIPRRHSQGAGRIRTGTARRGRFPAYSHKNPLINWLFWQRLRKAMDYIEAGAPYENVLDFGCGSGVMLPFLCRISTRVTAMDIDLLPFERVSRQRAFPANLQVHDAREVTLSDLPKASFDLIVATDVLEHVEDIRRNIERYEKPA